MTRLMPALPASDSRALMIVCRSGEPLAYWTANCSFSPLVMPAPQSPAAVPGLTQVAGSPEELQPLATSRARALLVLNGNWSFCSPGARVLLDGRVGTPWVFT